MKFKYSIQVPVFVAWACLLLPHHALAQAVFPIESWHPATIGIAQSGAAKRGMDYMRLNPAALPSGRVWAYGIYRRAGIEAVDAEAAIGFPVRALGIGASFRIRSWGEVAKDLGVKGLEVTEMSFGLTVSRQVFNVLVLGFSAAFLQGSYVGHKVDGSQFDAGIQLRVFDHVRLGAALLGVGELGAHSINTSRRIGIALDLPLHPLAMTTVTVDVSARESQQYATRYRGGVVVQVLAHLSFRGGCVYGPTMDPSGLPCAGGFGIRIGSATFDLSYLNAESAFQGGISLSAGLAI